MNYYILSILLGIFIKMLDDIIDLKNLKFLKKTYIVEVCKFMIILISYIAIEKSYISCIIIFCGLLASNYCKPFDNDFWYVYLYFIGLYCLLNIKKFPEIIVDNFEIKLLFILFLPITIFFEENNYCEEISQNKMIERSINIVINSIIILFLEYSNITNEYDLYFFTYLILFINSYFLTGIIIQLIILYKIIPSRKQKKRKTEKQKKEKQKKRKREYISLQKKRKIFLLQ